VSKTLKRDLLSVKRDRTTLLNEAVRVTPIIFEEGALDQEDVRVTPTGSFSSAGAVEA
jgi:hypothetical protein